MQRIVLRATERKHKFQLATDVVDLYVVATSSRVQQLLARTLEMINLPSVFANKQLVSKMTLQQVEILAQYFPQSKNLTKAVKTLQVQQSEET